jgi:hypothetical protein
MWSFLRSPFRQRIRIRDPPPKPYSHSRAPYVVMSSASGAAAVLYATAVSQAVGEAQKKPDDAALAKHHATSGRGFLNPWDSFLNRSVWQIAGAMIM